MQPTIPSLVNLIDPAGQQIRNMSVADAEALLLSGEPRDVLGIEGSFALLARDGEKVVLARSLDRPLRYFLAKQAAGPLLVVGERMDEIRAHLDKLGYADQFHPTYSRMVPAHHTTTIRLVGCPDPNPVYRRFFDPPRGVLPADLDLLGERYIGALAQEIRSWLLATPKDEPLGVLFSGGADSGAVLLVVHHLLLELGMSPSRLKAFTLAVDSGDGDVGGGDLDQARDFLRRVDLEMLLEPVEVPASAIDPLRAVEVIEDYKPRDVECAAVTLALLGALRERYPTWRRLIDGDGGDENLKDYPIEENSELTIRSVVGNSMLYQEGWGVEAIKHSLTYSGGQSRGCVRTWAPARRHGFVGFSPYTRPSVIEVAEAIPFDALTQGETTEERHAKLYALKGEIARRGVKKHFGVDMPIYPKRRFQHGAVPERVVEEKLAAPEAMYREHFLGLHR